MKPLVLMPINPDADTHAQRMIVLFGFGGVALIAFLALLWMGYDEIRRRSCKARSTERATEVGSVGVEM